ncbi:MAG TPA: sugar ABC transporter permease YjfF [Planctomycetota bacterium]|nr:sugar ABC transporter permease YjfF [Planctomycetota bacterium]HRR79374.1 sugar ABC transporter permease YjfF [Planctomycetota bacterium]HRT93727.1 sugar ABC transporter permease YjfF [Planctomycetota bacterium]
MKLPFSRKHVPLLSTVAVFLLLYAVCAVRYRGEGFLSLQVFVNFFGDNSFLGIVAVGMTFVILSGGIDLSVGSVLALSSILMAVLTEKAGVPPLAAMGAVLATGACLGLAMGGVVRFFGLPPFIVTLAGMFLARGLGFVLQIESIPITSPFYRGLTSWGLALPGARVPATALVFLAIVAGGVYLSTQTVFGRNVYALGGSEEAALLMGVPVGRTKVLVYGLSGFCSALAGIVYTVYGSSGDPRAALGMELDAIAAVVVGGTLLTGGVGYVAGTLMGVLIFGIIQTGITFEGTLSSWWTRVAIGALLLVFVLLQKLFARPGAGEPGSA